MKKLVGVTCGLLVFSAGWCMGGAQADKHFPGGTGWKSLTPTERDLYVAGFLHGYATAIVHAGALADAKESHQNTSSMPADEKSELAMAKKVLPLFLREDPTASQLDPTITTLYGDYRNMPVCFDDAILLSAASLAGNAATDQEVDAARKRGAEKGCK
jgi:hypothetical protein